MLAQQVTREKREVLERDLSLFRRRQQPSAAPVLALERDVPCRLRDRALHTRARGRVDDGSLTSAVGGAALVLANCVGAEGAPQRAPEGVTIGHRG